ncbi:MAG TPA: hypothetical protein VHY19_07350 [Steroidobacteraceae bacterium]|jgi:hypothetical protein|nr:hypothetical protein [Steroidobacteraceae bacterium]
MSAEPTAVIDYVIEGMRVTCLQDERGKRVWQCGCSEFVRRQRNIGEGFCAHTALAIERALREGLIKP